MTASHLREVGIDGVIQPGGVAAELHALRLQRGVDLRDVSAAVRIRYTHLLAIEEGRFSDLPGPAYVVGFLRSYAAYLGLDGGDLVRRFKAEATKFNTRQDLNLLKPYDGGEVPTGTLIALALALAVGAYGSWYYVANTNNIAIEPVPEVPKRMIAALATEPAESPRRNSRSEETPRRNSRLEETPRRNSRLEESPETVPMTATIQNPADTMRYEPAPAPGIELIIPEPTAVERPESASLRRVIPAAEIEPTEHSPRAFARADAGSIITLRAREESWIQITDTDKTLLLTRILQPGDVYYAPNRSGLMLMTGNAGGIEILVDGKLAPSLGKTGTVRRRVALDPERLLAGTAVSP